MEACLELLRSVNSSVLVGFDSNKSELGKMYVEAKDNVRFLMTLERHFKNITAGNWNYNTELKLTSILSLVENG